MSRALGGTCSCRRDGSIPEFDSRGVGRRPARSATRSTSPDVTPPPYRARRPSARQRDRRHGGGRRRAERQRSRRRRPRPRRRPTRPRRRPRPRSNDGPDRPRSRRIERSGRRGRSVSLRPPGNLGRCAFSSASEIPGPDMREPARHRLRAADEIARVHRRGPLPRRFHGADRRGDDRRARRPSCSSPRPT